MGWREFQTSIPLDNIDNIDNMRGKSHKVDLVDKVYRGGIVKTETIYCDFIKIDVSKDECHKPLSCFYRNEDAKPGECQHLKTFVRQRNEELGIQI